jgi:hypothetical protein
MAQAQKPDFVFRRNGEVNKSVGASVQSTASSGGVRTSGSNAGYTMFRGSVKSTGYPLHSPVSPSLPLPCVTVCHHVSTGLYQRIGCTCFISPVINPKEHKLSFSSYFHQQNKCEKAVCSSNVSTAWGERTLLEFHSENYSWNVTSPCIYFTLWCKRTRYFYLQIKLTDYCSR